MRPSMSLRAALCAATLIAGPALAAEYQIDPDHTFAAFEIGHFGTSTNRAQFEKTTGTVSFDRAAKTGQVDVRIDTRSVHSGSPDFDKDLKSDKLFHAERFPEMRYVSERFEFKGDQVAHVHGQLTLLGKTHPVILNATQFNCYQSPILKAEVCGGDFSATIDRTQWGMDAFVKMGIPKEVRLDIQIEATRK